MSMPSEWTDVQEKGRLPHHLPISRNNDATVPAPDLEEAERFLGLLAEGEELHTFQTFDDNKVRKDSRLARILCGSLETHSAMLTRANAAGAGVFVMVQRGNGNGRTNANVTGVRAIFCEDDSSEGAREFPLEPHVVVESSPGKYHYYFLCDGLSFDDYGGVMARMVGSYGSDPNAKDLARVLRLPGFYHLKNPTAPFRVRIVSESGAQPFSRDEIIRAFPPITQPKALPSPATGDGAIAEGGRNAHLTSLAGSMRRRGMSRTAILAALVEENRTRCVPPLGDKEVQAIARSVARYEPQPYRDDQRAAPAPEWPAPILPTATLVPEVPAMLLPGWVGDMASAVSEWSQTPKVMSVLIGLSVLSTALQRRFVVSPWGDDHVEPLSLWTLTAMESGSRKSAVIGAFTSVLAHWEKLQRDRMRADIARNAAAREVAEKRIEKLRQDAAKAKSLEEREAITAEIQTEKENLPEELRAPRLSSGDINAEGLQRSLVEHDGRWAVLTDEGGVFSVMAGLHTGGQSNLDVFLQGHAGTHLRVDRAGRSAYVDQPALAFGMALQPGILKDAAKSRKFRDSGLLARFLYAVPVSNVGYRNLRQRTPIPDAIKAAWEHNIIELLDSIERPLGKPRSLPFTAAALERWLCFSEEIERDQRPGGRFAHIKDWSSKLPGAVARIAGLLELAMNGVNAQLVGVDSVARAIQLARLLVPHAEAAFALMGAGAAEDDATALLAWIKDRRVDTLNRREAMRALRGRFTTMDKLKAAIEQLEDWHVLGREAREQGSPKGGRPSPVYPVNPKIHTTSET